MNLKKIIKDADGNMGIAALKAGISLEELAEELEKDPDLKKLVDDKKEAVEQAFKEITEIQLKMGIIKGEKWAINAMLRREQGLGITINDGAGSGEWSVNVTQVGNQPKGASQGNDQ